MSGFNYIAGMSNNAVSAYNSGLAPASKVKGIPSTLIKKFCHSKEWHHTSGRFFNETDFYDNIAGKTLLFKGVMIGDTILFFDMKY